MNTERWHRVDDLFAATVELAEEERQAYLDRACEQDASLKGEVMALLEAHERAEAFLAQPIAHLQAPGLLPSSVADDTGDRLGPYRLLRILGQGGMGSVYLGAREDDQYERLVAVKVVRGGLETPGLLERFRRERQILASLEHPYIARLYDGGTAEDGRPFLAMELVEGRPITEYCDHQDLDLGERLDLFRKVCSAVQYAHQYLLVHRDLKPANILVQEGGVPKLLDFGIAKPLDGALLPHAFRTADSESRLMTLDYASPEQIRGEPIGTASDIYSLGVLLFELLTGEKPYRGATVSALEEAICHEPVPLPSRQEKSPGSGSRRLSRLRGDLDNIVLTALRKEPGRRYGTAADLAEDLRRFQANLPVAARPDTATYRFHKFVRRHRIAVLSALLVSALLVGYALFTRQQSIRLAHQRDIAERERGRAQQVSTFLEELFEIADPSLSRGNDLRVREVLDRGAEKLSALDDQPELQARQSIVIGRVYRSLGLFEESERLLQEGLRQRQAIFGSEHEEVAYAMAELGELRFFQGRPADAEELFRETLAIRRSVLRSPHRDLATTLEGLGVLRHRQGDYSAAEAYYEEALAIARQVMGDEESHLPILLDNLAALRQAQGNLGGAEPMFREALALSREVLGNDHPDTAINLGNTAGLLQDLGQFQEAEALFREALSVKLQLYGEEHTSVAITQQSYAHLLHTVGRYDEAEGMYQKALATRRASLGEEHRRYADTLCGLGRLWVDRGDVERGLPQIRSAIALRQDRLKLEDRRLSVYLENLGFALLESGEPLEAQQSIEEALAIKQKALAVDHPDVVLSRVGLARVFFEQGQFSRARSLVEQSLVAWGQNLPVDHWKLSWARSLLGASLMREGREEEARQLLPASVLELRRQMGPQTPYVRDAERWLGELKAAEGQE